MILQCIDKIWKLFKLNFHFDLSQKTQAIIPKKTNFYPTLFSLRNRKKEYLNSYILGGTPAISFSFHNFRDVNNATLNNSDQ